MPDDQRKSERPDGGAQYEETKDFGKGADTQARSPSAGGRRNAASWQLPGGRYEVVGEIARGGMGVVLRAIDNEVQRTLAVKVMLGSPHTEKHERFLAEARITGQLQHPGVPPVHEIGRLEDGLPFFSMKLIEGHTLTELLRGRKTPQEDLPRLLMIFEQVAQTVAYAHSGGIIHRDLKPANIMVGSFGEVQVMDWGLAKKLPEEKGGTAGFDKAAPHGSTSKLAASLAETIDRRPPDGDTRSRTQAGQVLGTLAYMPPEQALGEVDRLDRRCDVFGLGAILCEMLTGKPPYVAQEGMDVYQLASRAKLDGCFARLDASGADEKLLSLTRRCLAAQPDDRPRDAGVVSRAVTTYLETVQQRLKEAEIQRAEAQARAVEEQKRAVEEQKRRRAEQAKARAEWQKRRLTLAVGGLVVVLLTGLVIGVTWYDRVQARQARQEAARAAAEQRRNNERAIEQAARDARREQLNEGVSLALRQAGRLREDLHVRLVDERRVHVFLSDIDEWERALARARTAWQRADALAQSDPKGLREEVADRLRELDEILNADGQDFELAEELDTIRQNTSLAIGGTWDPASAAAEYPATFRKAGCDVENGDIRDVAKKIRESSIRYALVAALDHWAQYADTARVLAIAREADPDVWRDRLRQVEVWDDAESLNRLAVEIELRRQSPQIINVLTARLRKAGSDPMPLLRKALVQYRRDYNLYFHLGSVATDLLEKIGSYRAALAVRPDSTAALCNLSDCLAQVGDLDGAIDHCRKALAMDPDFKFVHVNLGNCLWKKGDRKGAIASYQNALRIDPEFPPALDRLRAALQVTGDPEAAIQKAQKMIDDAPDSALGYHNMGLALEAGDLEGAITNFQKAISIDPDFASAHYNLGRLLSKQGDWEGAAASYRRAIASDPGHAEAHCNLANVLKFQGKFDEALEMLQHGHELGSQRENWRYPSGTWLARAKRRVALDRKATAILHGEATPADAREQAEMAELLGYKKQYADAARFYAEALRAEPSLATHRYAAARAAAQAIAQEGDDQLSDAERQAWREQARKWLRAELQKWTIRLERSPRTASSVKDRLQAWQTDPGLAAIREEASLEGLPADEQTAWRQLWADVGDLLRRVETPPR